VMDGARRAIGEGAYDDYCATIRAGWAQGDLPAVS